MSVFKTGRLDRSVVLHFMGDPGFANFTRILGWLAGGLNARSGPHSQVAIWTGWGFLDNIVAVGRGRVDVAIATPASFIPMAMKGQGPFRDEPFPHLRALATISQYDRLVLMVTEESGVRSLDDLRHKRLRIATAPNDGVNFIGMAADRILEMAGANVEVIRSPWYRGCIDLVRQGEADGLFQEAIMNQTFQDLCRDRKMHCIALEPAILDELERELSWQRASVPAGYFPQQAEGFETLSFADFLVFCREDLSEDVAYVLARTMTEDRPGLERHYRHIPPERSGVTYPLEPRNMGQTTIPLHPGAARWYDSLPQE
ncbi:MAG: TAXI family TRAP transporter solute-binding subunit [Chloroflexi bacterium]|nr:TAXI family TRAP transporter solute-binding subunit [Chloroflexota bacterium]